MSFDVYVEYPACDHCGVRRTGPFEFNLTHNVNSIVDLCLIAAGSPVSKKPGSSYAERSWGRLEGWSAVDALPIVEAARQVAHDPRREAEFKALEPENKWGSLAAVRERFDELAAALKEYQTCFIRTWG